MRWTEIPEAEEYALNEMRIIDLQIGTNDRVLTNKSVQILLRRAFQSGYNFKETQNGTNPTDNL